MPADVSAKTRSLHSAPAAIGRRAVLGLGLLVVMTGGAAGLLYSSIEPGHEFAKDPDAARRNALLNQVSTWSQAADLERIEAAALAGDQMLVVESSDVATRRLSSAQKLVEDLQRRDNGTRRLVLAAVTLRSHASTGGNMPELGLLDALVARNVDGVFLDCAAAAAHARQGGRAAEESVVAAVLGLVERARLVNPNFLVVIENAAELTVDPRLQKVIDAVAKSDLLFGMEGAGVPNPRTEIVAALHDLNRVRKTGRPVFVTERLPADAREARAGARQTLATLGFVGRLAVAGQPG